MSCGDSPATRGLTPILGRQHQLREFFSRYWFCSLERGASPLPLLQPQFPSALSSRVQESETLLQMPVPRAPCEILNQPAHCSLPQFPQWNEDIWFGDG